MYCKSGGNSCRLPERFSSEDYFSVAVTKIRATSDFGLKVILVGYIFVSGNCTLQLSCETIPKLA